MKKYFYLLYCFLQQVTISFLSITHIVNIQKFYIYQIFDYSLIGVNCPMIFNNQRPTELF